MYKIDFETSYKRSYKKLDVSVKRVVVEWVQKNIDGCTNPRFDGKPLKGEYKGCWRYKIGNYRLLVVIDDKNRVVKMVSVQHRKDVYKKSKGKIKGLLEEEEMVENLNEEYEDDFTEEETLYDLELVRQCERDKKGV